jgi:hypothetical protein
LITEQHSAAICQEFRELWRRICAADEEVDLRASSSLHNTSKKLNQLTYASGVSRKQQPKAPPASNIFKSPNGFPSHSETVCQSNHTHHTSAPLCAIRLTLTAWTLVDESVADCPQIREPPYLQGRQPAAAPDGNPVCCEEISMQGSRFSSCSLQLLR